MTRVNLGAWSFWMPALISAAEATKSLRVGTNVLNNDFRHPVLVAREAATIDLLTEGYAQLELNALVQRVVVTDHPRQAAEELARRWTQLSPEEILQSPYVLIGTVDKLIEDLHARRKCWGISYYVIFEPYVDALAAVVARLAGK